ncbi:MAG: hypothetical protein ACETWM_19450 [Candidatus Lokiarchaeia archaeon]
MKVAKGVKEKLCKPDRVIRNQKKLPIFAIKISESNSSDYAIFECYPKNYVNGDKEFVEEIIALIIEDFGSAGYSLYDKSELDAKIERLLRRKLPSGIRLVKVLDHVKGVFEKVQVKCDIHVFPL